MTYCSTAKTDWTAAIPVGARRLELEFAATPTGTSYIARQYAEYPFHVCRPHYLDQAPPGLATLYFQSCSGGLFEGDSLACSILARASSEVHLTTQASTIVHSSRCGKPAVHRAFLSAEENSLVEFLPDPVILFPQATLDARLDIVLHPTASVVASDSFILHDPHGRGDPPGRLTTTISARSSDGPLLTADRVCVSGEALRPGKPGILGVWKCLGTMVFLTNRRPPEKLCDAIREALTGCQDIYTGVSTLPNEAGAWARFLSGDAVSLRLAMQQAWKAMRLLMRGTEPVARPK